MVTVKIEMFQGGESMGIYFKQNLVLFLTLNFSFPPFFALFSFKIRVFALNLVKTKYFSYTKNVRKIQVYIPRL